MINPANHAKSQEAIATYKVEPYVMAADVYAVAPHTGSAGWVYRLIVESLLWACGWKWTGCMFHLACRRTGRR